jgi:hypothetical protein
MDRWSEYLQALFGIFLNSLIGCQNLKTKMGNTSNRFEINGVEVTMHSFANKINTEAIDELLYAHFLVETGVDKPYTEEPTVV